MQNMCLIRFALSALVSVLLVKPSHSFVPGFASPRPGSSSRSASRWTSDTKSNPWITGSTRSCGSTPGKTRCNAGDEEILEPQGTHWPSDSIQPALEALSWATTPGTYYQTFNNSYGGDPIYKCHPGVASIAITDYASGVWFFNQPDSVLDRQVCVFKVDGYMILEGSIDTH